MKKIFLLLLFAICSILANNAIATNCDGPYKDKKLTSSAVKKLLATKEPLNLCGVDLQGEDLSALELAEVNLSNANLEKANLSASDLTRADLTNSDLNSAIMHKAFFKWANLTGANLINADLNQADLSHSNLEDTNFERAKLIKANLQYANLNNSKLSLAKMPEADLTKASLEKALLLSVNFTNANLHMANFSDANLNAADLTGADLTEANLSNANASEADFTNAILFHTNLLNTDFTNANFQETTFNPLLGKLPNIVSLVSAKNFRTIKFYDETIGAPSLNELRAQYQKANMRNMERLLTSMVKTRQMQRSFEAGGSKQLLAGFNYVMFYLTSEFGLKPLRPLGIFLALILLYAFIYRATLSLHKSKFGIYVHWVARIKNKNVTINKKITTRNFVNLSHELKQQLKYLGTALYFSVLSAFQIGWDDFNISYWLRRLQFKEYELTPMGVLRLVSGSQALISAYLIILWALVYFGHPFQW